MPQKFPLFPCRWQHRIPWRRWHGQPRIRFPKPPYLPGWPEHPCRWQLHWQPMHQQYRPKRPGSFRLQPWTFLRKPENSFRWRWNRCQRRWHFPRWLPSVPQRPWHRCRWLWCRFWSRQQRCHRRPRPWHTFRLPGSCSRKRWHRYWMQHFHCQKPWHHWHWQRSVLQKPGTGRL